MLKKVPEKMRNFYDRCMPFISKSILIRQNPREKITMLNIKISSRYYLQIRLPEKRR